MKKASSRAVASLLAVALLAVVAAPVSASSVRVDVNPSAQTANWHSQKNLYVNFTYPSTGLISQALNNSSGSISLNITSKSSASVNTVASINGTIAAEYSHAYISSFALYYNATWKANQTKLAVVVTSTLDMAVKGIGNGTAASVNMSWKDFNYTKSINVSTSTSGTVDVNSASGPLAYSKITSFVSNSQTRLSVYHALDFSAFAKQLSQWNRSYSSATGKTVYSYNAGVTLNRSFNMSYSTSGISGNYTLSIYLDPSAQIVTDGNTYAKGNTLYIQPANGIGPGVLVVAGVVVVLFAAGAAALILRRRSKAN